MNYKFNSLKQETVSIFYQQTRASFCVAACAKSIHVEVVIK